MVRETHDRDAGSVALGGRRGPPLVLSSPLLAASGCFGDGALFAGSPWQRELGGLVTPTITDGSRVGGRPRVMEAPAGVFYEAAWTRKSAGRGRRARSPGWASLGVPVIVSVAGGTPEALIDLVDDLAGTAGVSAFELNLAWPGVPVEEAESPQTIEAFVTALATATDLPLFAKLTPDANIVSRAVAAVAAGADAVVVGHGWPAAGSATRDGDTRLRWGALGGPAIRLLTLALVDRVAREAGADVIACGGVSSTADARAYLAAGARAVQLGSALLRDPSLGARIARQFAGTEPDSAGLP